MAFLGLFSFKILRVEGSTTPGNMMLKQLFTSHRLEDISRRESELLPSAFISDSATRARARILFSRTAFFLSNATACSLARIYRLISNGML